MTGPGNVSERTSASRGATRIGRFDGVPIEIHWSVLVIVALVANVLAMTVLPGGAPGLPGGAYWSVALVVGVLLVASVAAHELAHVAVARHYGIEVRRVRLWLVGGASELVTEPDRPWRQVVVAAVGPLLSLLTGGALLAVAAVGTVGGWPALLTVAIGWLATMNLLLGAFNLLPGAPLDGGRVLYGLVWAATADRAKGRRAAVLSGQLIGAALAVLGVVLLWTGYWDGLWLMLIGWFVMSSAAAERAVAATAARVQGLQIKDAMRPIDTVAPAWWTAAAFADQVVRRGAAAIDRSFVVVGWDGDPVGVLALSVLSRLAPGTRTEKRVADVGSPLPADRVVGPDDPLERVLGLVPLAGGDLLAVVVDGRSTVATVTIGGVAAALELSALRDGVQA
ncbi:site-2 protease family protein [Pseudonocardia sp. GCM10023141]|uniref:site-2 protease family protein n=1 Tax=Pseudonocardia sp. GCM10023141 TaxID=3252653 RepID=UPI00360A6541